MRYFILDIYFLQHKGYFYGVYRAPVFSELLAVAPPQIIIFVPVHSAVCQLRAGTVEFTAIELQVSAVGSYIPPSFRKAELIFLEPPQTNIFDPDHTAV